VVTDGGDGNAYDHADWAGALLTASVPGATPPPSPDTQAPSVPANLRSTGTTSSTISLAWDASTDDRGVAGYNVYRNGNLAGSPTGLSFTDTNLTANTTYTYTVKAFDAVPNTSNPTPPLNVTTSAALATTTYLSDLTPTSVVNGWGPMEKDQSNGEQAANDGKTIALNGVTYAKGLGVHAGSDVSYALNGKYTGFSSDIGVDDEVGTHGSVDFQVYLDGVLAYDSSLMTGSSATKTILLNVTGKTTLRLVVTDGGDGNAYDHADWAGAKLQS
jgi:chitodextrinase